MTFEELPFIVMESVALIGGALASWLPETLGYPLPESMEDVKGFDRNPKKFWSWWSTEKVEAQLELNRRI